MLYFFLILLLLFLESSQFSFLLIISTTKQNIDPSRVNYQVRANYRSGIYQPERPERPERWGERTLTTTSVCCSPWGRTVGGTRPGLAGLIQTKCRDWRPESGQEFSRILKSWNFIKFYYQTLRWFSSVQEQRVERGFRIDGCSSSQLQNKNS